MDVSYSSDNDNDNDDIMLSDVIGGGAKFKPVIVIGDIVMICTFLSLMIGTVVNTWRATFLLQGKAPLKSIVIMNSCLSASVYTHLTILVMDVLSTSRPLWLHLLE